ncbi:thrombomodulin [Discoglossus pictus]
MMLLLHTVLGVVLSAQIVDPAPLDESSQDFYCIDKTCYSVSWSSKKYKEAKRICKNQGGQLMTVRNTVEADAVLLLMHKVQRDNPSLWIGLEQPEKDKCTDISQKLRGYRWTAGDSHTDYTNWMSEEVKCDQHCVSVQKNSKWREISCNQKTDGFLCEFISNDLCAPIQLTDGYSATYQTPFGMGGSDLSVLPIGTVALVTNLHSPLICNSRSDGSMKWTSLTPGAWACPVENGGCEFICMGDYTNPVCSCAEDQFLKADGRSCSLEVPDPCDPNPCAQQCSPDPTSLGFTCMCDQGFVLGEDGKSCEDIDDCAIEPKVCEQQCSNTVGSFVCSCYLGYEMVEEQCLDIDECELPKPVCEHDCTNSLGSYECTCYEGYILDEKRPGRCKQFCNSSVCEAKCNNVHARDGCICPEGYVLDDGDDDFDNYDRAPPMCSDVDECESGICADICINLPGTYECSCTDGYILQKDSSCLPIEGSGGTEEPSELPSSTETPSKASPTNSPILQPAMLLGISVGILSILTILIGIICHMVRKHYVEQAAMDYKCKGSEKGVVLQQVKSTPQQKL